MELNKVWLAYVNEHMRPDAGKLPPVELTAEHTLERLFSLHPMLTQRWLAIRETPYSTAFDNDADTALISLADQGSFADWETMAAGTWRVIADRLKYAEVLLFVLMARGDGVIIDRLPQGLARDQQAIALLLKYALGTARTIDPQLLDQSDREGWPAFPATFPLRPQ